MGWLFATALGLQPAEPQRVVWLSLIPIAVGMRFRSPSSWPLSWRWACPRSHLLGSVGPGPCSWAGPSITRFNGHRHLRRVGMQTGMVGLGPVSFTMATGHGR